MKKHYISGAILTIALFSILPIGAHAYFTTDQSAFKLNERTAVYSIKYAFGLEDYDIYMPIFAERDLSWDANDKKVGYSMREDGVEAVAHGAATGLVLSGAPIVDGMYKIAKGAAQEMILFVILTIPEDTLEMDYALQVDKLPYYVDKGGDELHALQLNPTELQYYITPEIELNSENKD